MRNPAGDQRSWETLRANGHEDSARLNRLVDELGRRFREIATRRVAADDVDDVVQEALRIVVQKSSGSGSFEELPPIAWSMQVLRNTVGNYYKRERTRRRWMETPDGDETPEGRAENRRIEFRLIG